MKKFNTDKELLSAYVDGELTQSDKNLIEEKIKSSLELQKELSDLKKLKELTSHSVKRIPDSPFFETRLFANLKSESESKSKLNIKKWIPISALSLITLGLMAILKFNPNLLNNLIEEQKSNLAGFYKENLKPLLYAANLTNEDIFNFALYQELPLDSANQQVLKLGYDPAGTEYFEIKNASDFDQVNNLKKFAAALELNDEEVDMIDSIIGSYSEEISALVLVNDKNSVAINPNIWNTRKIILADILAFAKKHAGDNYSKILPTQMAQFDSRSIVKWVSEAKALKDDQYIFCTSDSIFRETFEFDMDEFSKNMEEMTKELAELHEQKALVNEYRFRIDSSFDKHKKHIDRSNQFEVTVDRDFIKVNVQSFGVDIPEIDLPDFDSIAIIINEATKNINVVHPPAPPVTVGKKNFNYNYNTVKPKKNRSSDVNLDSLMHEKNIEVDSKRSEQQKRFKDQSPETSSGYYFNDSLIILQNQDLKKEMDKLRRELEQFRKDLTIPQKDDSLKSKKSIQKIKATGVKVIEI
jgi:hypothetical protein